MSSRESILSKIKANQPNLRELPNLSVLGNDKFDVIDKFTNTLEGIGGKVIDVNNFEEIKAYISSNFGDEKRVISTLREFSSLEWLSDLSLSLNDVDFLLIQGQIGIAENGSIWLSDSDLGQRVAPFISQYLGIVLQKSALVPTMHQAYEKIGSFDYGFGVFLAGPSKTADIEQSLVLGAHGARGLIVFLM